MINTETKYIHVKVLESSYFYPLKGFIMRFNVKHFFGFVLFFLIFSCKPEGQKKEAPPTIDYKESLINFSFFYTEYENWMSFPVWFNDSLIQKEGIESITREVFSQGIEDTSLFITEVLNHRWVYEFNADGTVKRVDAASIYDAKIISEVLFNYRGLDRHTGYSQVMVSEKEMSDYENLPYVIHNKKQENKDWVSFTEWSNQYNVFVLNNEEHWKALVIDTLIGPKPVDFIIYGGVIRPKKSYKVSNLVEENTVRNYTYQGTHLSEIERIEDPFVNRKKFEYDNNGYLTKVIDSTFSMGGFVNKSILKINYKDGLPHLITKVLQRKGEEKVMYSERLTYTFNTKKD